LWSVSRTRQIDCCTGWSAVFRPTGQNLSKRALNALTVQASTTELGRLFQVLATHAEKNTFVNHNES